MTFSVEITQISGNFVDMYLTVGSGPAQGLDLRVDEAQALIRRLQPVELTPKGHPFYDFLREGTQSKTDADGQH